MLDREFDTSRLRGLRPAVMNFASTCGMPPDRVIDVLLAVHELAANAVQHGAGYGRLQLSVTASTLRCQVSDPGLPGTGGSAPDGPGGQDGGAVPWPVVQGHGLWVVHLVADEVSVTSGPHGSLITAVFSLPDGDGPGSCGGTGC